MTNTTSRTAFCQLELERYGTALGLKPSQLAEDFVTYFEVSELPLLEEMCVVAEDYGFGRPTPYPLPDGLRGFHHRLSSGDYELLYTWGMYTGSQVFTVLHEMYEQMCETLAELDAGFVCPASPGSLCYLANCFASKVVMQDHMVRSALAETGFDLIDMHHRFRQAYSAVAIRAVEVMNDGSEVPIFTAVYEDPAWKEPNGQVPTKRHALFSATVAKGARELFGPRRRWQKKALMPPHIFIPRRKDKVREGSLVDQVIARGEAVYLERVSGFDFWGERDMAFLARPVKWYGRVAKVVLVGVRASDSRVLETQLAKCQPWLMPQSFQQV